MYNHTSLTFAQNLPNPFNKMGYIDFVNGFGKIVKSHYFTFGPKVNQLSSLG